MGVPRMKMSEFIAGCQALMAEHGDHDVMHEYGTHASLPWFCDEGLDEPDPRYLLSLEEIDGAR